MIVDRGFLRGTDVVKALALGAKAVLVGKLQTWGLAAGDEAGLDRALDLLDREIRRRFNCSESRAWTSCGRHTSAPASPTRQALDDWNHYEAAPLPRL